MAQMTKKALERVIESQISNSTFFEATEVTGNQKAALDSYYGRRRPKTSDGRSNAVSQDVADMVEATVSQITPSFDFDIIAKFQAKGRADADQANVETIVCNNHFRNGNHGYTIIQEAIRNALLLRVGILRIWAEEEEDIRTRSYNDLNELELAQVTEADAPDQLVEIVSAEESDDGDGVDVTVRKTTKFRRLSMRSIDPVNFLVVKEWESIDLQGVPYCGERFFLTKTDLLNRGVSKSVVNSLPTTDSDTHIASRARDRSESAPFLEDHGDKSMLFVECYELYSLIDFDGDGKAERRRVLYAGGTSAGTVLENEPHSGVPYATGTGFLQPQRWLGLSLYDKLAELESIKTEVLRQWLDNMAFANNAEVLAVDGAVELDDLKARRPGGINRVDDINAVRELVVPDLGGSSRSLLDWLDATRSERGGASLDLQNAQLQIAGETAGGIAQQFQSRESLARLMTRTIAETLIRQTFLLIHRTLREQFPDRAEVQIGSEFAEYEPGKWAYREELDIVAGMSFGERAERRQSLESVLAQQEKLQGAGLGSGILVDLQTYHDTLLDWTSAGGVQNARRYWIDPRSETSVQAQQQAQESAQQQAGQQQERENQFLQAQIGITQDRLAFDMLSEAMDKRFDYWAKTLDGRLKEQAVDAQWGDGNADPAATDENLETGEARSEGANRPVRSVQGAV